MYGGNVSGGGLSQEDKKNLGRSALAGIAVGALTRSPLAGIATFGAVELLQNKKWLGMKGGKQRRSPAKRSRSKKWIQSVVRSKSFRSGSFTRQAAAHQMTTKQFMRQVLAHPTRYSLTTRRRAQFLKNIQRSK